jgi:hypothetical protein
MVFGWMVGPPPSVGSQRSRHDCWITSTSVDPFGNREVSTAILSFRRGFSRAGFDSAVSISFRYGDLDDGFPEVRLFDTLQSFSSYLGMLSEYIDRNTQKITEAIQVSEYWGRGVLSANFYVRDKVVFARELAAFRDG